MDTQPPQTLANHVRMDSSFHYVLAPMIFLATGLALWNVVRDPNLPAVVLLLLAGCILLTSVKARLYSLKVQDRVIRLEERLRLTSLLAEPLRSRIGELTEGQLVALRFASDVEVPALVEKSLAHKLKPGEIKKAIGQWRPDYFRV